MGRAGDFTLTPYRGTGQALQSSPIKGEEESRSIRGSLVRSSRFWAPTRDAATDSFSLVVCRVYARRLPPDRQEAGNCQSQPYEHQDGHRLGEYEQAG